MLKSISESNYADKLGDPFPILIECNHYNGQNWEPIRLAIYNFN